MIAIPLIASFASGAVGAVVAGTAGFAAYASVAGAVLSTVGALTGDKDMQKLGMFAGLAGGIANIASSATDASSALANGADPFGSNAASIADAGAAAGGVEAAANLASSATDPTSALAGGADPFGSNAASIADAGQAAAGIAPDAAFGAAGTVPTPMDATSMLAAPTGDAAANTFSATGTPMLGNAPNPYESASSMPGSEIYNATNPAVSSLQQAAADHGVTWNDIQNLYEKAATGVKGVGKWMNQNQELTKFGLNMVQGAYGPQAEQIDWNKSIYNRNRANLNAPVKLQFNTKPGG